MRDLAGWGVPVVFGVAGDDILPLLDAFAREGSPRYVAATHEANAAFMAAAWGALTGQPGVCVAGAAGVVNLLEGLAEAALDRVPVLALTGQLDTGKLGSRAKQYFNQQRVAAEFAVTTELVADAPAGVRLLHQALAVAWLRRGVAHLSVPGDLWTRPVQAVPSRRPALLGPPVSPGEVRGDVARAAALVRRARRPLLVLGREAAPAAEAARRLGEAWGAAVVVAQDARGVVEESWPAVVGGVGEGWLPDLVGEADGVVLVGTASFEAGYLPRAPVIQVTADPGEVAPAYLWDSVTGDPGVVLAGLAGAAAETEPDPAWQARIAAARRAWDELRAADLGRGDRPVHPARLMAELGAALPEDAVIALDEGALGHWFARDFRAARQRVLLSAWWRNMGAGLPGALAAALAFPGRTAVAVTGDGGLLMSHGELVTAVRYSLPVKVIVVRNGVYGLERDKAAQAALKPVGLELAAPDFRRYAESCGVAGFRVEDPAELRPVLNQALSLAGPALVEVACADVRLPFPPAAGR